MEGEISLMRNSKLARFFSNWTAKKITVTIITILIIFALFIRINNGQKPASTTAGILTSTVQRGTIEQTIQGTGTLRPSERFVLKSKAGGRVEEVFVNEGSQVKAGDPILRINNELIASQSKQATIQWELAQKDLNELLEPNISSPTIRAAQLKVEQYQIALNKKEEEVESLTFKAPFDGTILSHELSIGQKVNIGQKAVKFATSNEVEVVAQLDDKDIISIAPGMEADIYVKGIGQNLKGKVKEVAFTGDPTSGKFQVILELTQPNEAIREGMQTYNTIFVVHNPERELFHYKQGPGYIRYAQSDEMLAEVSGTVVEIYHEQGAKVSKGEPLMLLSNPELERQLKEVRLQLENAEDELRQLINPDDEVIKKQELKVLQSYDSYLTAKDKHDSLFVISPIDGVVVSLAVSPGEELSSSSLEQELAVVSSFTQTEMTIAVDELDINKITMGQEATIEVDALPNKKLTGKIIGIAYEGTTINEITRYDVTLAVDYAEGIKGGMSATATIFLEKKENVLRVPSEAVTTENGQSTIQVMVDGVPQNRIIEVGLITDRWVEVISGLQEGEEVVVAIAEKRGIEIMFGGQETDGPHSQGANSSRNPGSNSDSLDRNMPPSPPNRD